MILTDRPQSLKVKTKKKKKEEKGSIEPSHETIPNHRGVRFISQQLTRFIPPLLSFFLFHLINSLRFKVPPNCSSSLPPSLSLSLSRSLSPGSFFFRPSSSALFPTTTRVPFKGINGREISSGKSLSKFRTTRGEGLSPFVRLVRSSDTEREPVLFLLSLEFFASPRDADTRLQLVTASLMDDHRGHASSCHRRLN